jgi:hypothetical protein
MKPTQDQLTEADWGHNWDGWEFFIDNQTPFDLVPFYTRASNIATATNPIKPGTTGFAKGIKSKVPFFNGPADADIGYKVGSAVAQVSIKGYFDGNVKRDTLQDKDRRLSVYFPDGPRDTPQLMVFTWAEPWGPNYDGWVFELTNNSGHELMYVPDGANNVERAPARLVNGETGILKGKHSVFGGPANCNFTYRRPDRPLDLGGIAISATSEATNVRVIGTKNGSIDIDYAARPAANVVQTLLFKPQG